MEIPFRKQYILSYVSGHFNVMGISFQILGDRLPRLSLVLGTNICCDIVYFKLAVVFERCRRLAQ